ncbi:MAG: tRNA(Met) cytidine acetyltransferase TmcA [Haloarculaceae archaeon]
MDAAARERIRDHAAALRTEARAADERRLLVVAGARDATYAAASAALDGAAVDPAATTVLSAADPDATGLDADHRHPDRSDRLLGDTRTAVVLDAHDAFPPNALGRAVGAVDGGGLLVLATPPLDAWPDRRDGFDEGLAVPPFGVEAVTGRFRRRLVATLRAHPGIAIVDADAGRIEREGTTDPAPRLPRESPGVPDAARFPAAAYRACLTVDQAEAVAALEALDGDAGTDAAPAIVVEADRGRGKSSACGLAAGALAAGGWDVLVTAPGYRNAREVFARAAELLADLGARAGTTDGDAGDDRTVRATGGGRVRFARPPDAAAATPDALIVDEAAALPVRLLSDLLATDVPVAFATTVHGYEGAGRGFAVRFRGRLSESERPVREVGLAEPVRYAPGDPIEAWAFRALLFDAGPPAEELIADATPERARYVRLAPESLREDEHRLRAAFGLLVTAHYRTEPNDLARLLDAPNLTARALLFDDRVVAVALLAHEGDLPASVRTAAYEGERIRGNMLPDVLTSQLRDPEAGTPRGLRVVRIAVHRAVRGRGLGSTLLARVRAEFDGDGDHGQGGAAGDGGGVRGPPAPGAARADPDPVGRRVGGDGVDYLGVGFGATPELLDFWRANGYRTIHLATSRNDASGEYSALMTLPLTGAGRALHDRSAAWFRRRIPDVLADALSDADPDVVRGALRASGADPDAVAPDLTDREWRTVAAAAFGPGVYEPAPGPFRRLALAELLVPGGDLTDREERLLVCKPLQARDWADVADALDYESPRACMRAFGAACRSLVERFGTPVARREAGRFR